MTEPTCTCHYSNAFVYEAEFECAVHGDREAKARMTVEEHARASAAALFGPSPEAVPTEADKCWLLGAEGE